MYYKNLCNARTLGEIIEYLSVDICHSHYSVSHAIDKQ